MQKNYKNVFVPLILEAIDAMFMMFPDLRANICVHEHKENTPLIWRQW